MGFSFTSFIFEIVNFVVLVWVLTRLVYRPLKTSLAERRRAEEERAERAASLSKEVAVEREALRGRQSELTDLRERVMREATEEAAEARARLIAEAREDAAADRARGRKLLQAERQAADAMMRELAIAESTRIAARLLDDLAPRALDEAMLKHLAAAVRTNAAEIAKEAERDGRETTEVDLRFARPPHDRDVELLRDVFRDALGTPPELVTSEDASLVAGVVARVGHRVLDASLSGNLAMLEDRARKIAEEQVPGG